MAEASRQQLLDSIKGALTSGKYSDLVITCGPDTHNVHKVIVCGRSKFFAGAIRFSGKEAEEGKIDLPEDEPAIIRLLMQYLYEGEYDPVLPVDVPSVAITSPSSTSTNKSTKGTSQTSTSQNINDTLGRVPHTCDRTREGHMYYTCSNMRICPHHYCGKNCGYNCNNFVCKQCILAVPLDCSADQLLTHAKMYEVADKYAVAGLKSLAKEKFERGCQKFWDDDNFPVAANYAFSTTPEEDKGLRSIVSKTISAHMDLIRKPEVESLMTEFNGLAFAILKEKAWKHGWLGHGNKQVGQEVSGVWG